MLGLIQQLLLSALGRLKFDLFFGIVSNMRSGFVGGVHGHYFWPSAFTHNWVPFQLNEQIRVGLALDRGSGEGLYFDACKIQP